MTESDLADDQIISAGRAGVSASTVAYHWPDMRQFIVDAIWHSVFRDMPVYLAGGHREVDPAKATMEGWLAVMAPTVAITPGAQGYYVRYARLIANICLQAHLDPGRRIGVRSHAQTVAVADVAHDVGEGLTGQIRQAALARIGVGDRWKQKDGGQDEKRFHRPSLKGRRRRGKGQKEEGRRSAGAP